MIAIEFQFLNGRYHATPWGRHVNEGTPEWPPSPWRILRALVAVWRRSARDVPQEQVRRILQALVEPPRFHLPAAVGAHTRVYMPPGRGEKYLVYDAFMAMERGASVLAIWSEARLSAGDAAALDRILGGITYLGRAESWCRARRRVDGVPHANCLPGAPEAAGRDVVAVVCPAPPLELENLMITTDALRGGSAGDPSLPPGARLMRYRLPQISGAQTARPLLPPGRITVVRYALDGNPAPALVQAFEIAYLARRAAMGRYGDQNDGASSTTLAGKDAEGNPLQGHQHAHYLVTDEDEDGRLDRLTIWAPAGFTPSELEALCGLETLWRGWDTPAIGLVLLGYGQDTDMPAFLRGPARIWRSVTPFVLPRHPHLRGPAGAKRLVEGPREQLLRELGRRGLLPSLLAVETEPVCTLRGSHRHWVEFRRWRPDRPPPTAGAFGFRLVFQEPVPGPITLGYGSHYSLGLFTPAGGP